ncbi:hypothetical protein FJZ18_00755 [Candidatus Pacearchaeota archaeon]|nr:hypothetical protein [Candidatus Pacearchaeota archaeon]
MQKIETQAVKEAREKRKVKYISYFLLAIMVVSTAGYALLSYTSTAPPSNSTTDDPLAFGKYPLSVSGQKVYLSFPREDVQNISFEGNVTLKDYFGNTLYISSYSTALQYEISDTLGKFVSRVQEACYGNCTKNLPEKNCTDNLIVIEESEERSINQENRCIFIKGDLKSIDAFIYKVMSN